jgi:predicted porin
MKKSLLALAALSAFATAAQAQSSVTISGNLEVSAVNKEVNQTVDNQNTGGSFVGTPGITFSGREDLGGGTYAGFGLTLDIETPTGQFHSTGGFTSSFATLGNAQLGEVKAGRVDVVGRDAAGVYRFMGDIGRIESSGNPGTYQQNNVAYTSPTFGGVTVAVSAADGGQTSATDTAERANSVLVRGAFGKLNAAYSSTNVKAAYTASTAAPASATTSMYAAGYDLGVAKVGAFYMTYEDKATTNGSKDVNGMGVNVAFALAKNVEAQIGMQNYENDTDSTKETEMVSIGLKYTMSKRTALYATYQQAKGGSGGVATAFDTTRGLEVVAEGANKKNTGYGVSIVHTF